MRFEIIHTDKTGSTNELAMQKIMSGKAYEGIIYVADYQTNGKGTGNNSWESEPGKNLLFSMILKPVFIEPARQFMLTQIISLCLKELLENEIKNSKISIKWPNDIYAGREKIAGILIQNIIQGNEYSYAVAGIGINVNQEIFLSGAPNPVSIIRLTGRKTDTEELLKKFLSLFEKKYGDYTFTAQNLDEQYKKALFRYKKPGMYFDRTTNEKFEAMIEDVNSFGQLLLRKPDDRSVRIYNFKGVEFII